MKIMAHKNYVAGWLDTSIHDFLEVLAPRSSSTKYALITCLDSNPNPADIREKSPELQSVNTKAHVLGTGLLLPMEALLDADARQQIFFGFDEVWFFPSKSIEPKPAALSIVGPARLDRRRLARVAKWMSHNACSLALGGGEGLNFAVRATGLVRNLLGHSIEQPHHSIPLFESACSH